MIWPFRKRTPPPPVVEEKDSLDFRKELAEQHRKLRRAQALKDRSSKVTSALGDEGRENHYIRRIRAAMGVPQ